MDSKFIVIVERLAGCDMYDEETNTEISFEQIDGKDYTIVTIAGVLDLESADKIGHLVNSSIPIEYDGKVIFDIRKADDRLRRKYASLRQFQACYKPYMFCNMLRPKNAGFKCFSTTF